MNKAERELMNELLIMAETSRQYEEGIQWAVNAIVAARMILEKKKPLFIAELSNNGITVKSMAFLKANLSKLGPIVKIKGYKDDELDYWVEFSDAIGNVIRISGFSWGYGGEGPNGLADACKTVGIPLVMREIINLPEKSNWEVNKTGKIMIDQKCPQLGDLVLGDNTTFMVEEIKDGNVRLINQTTGYETVELSDSFQQADDIQVWVTK